MQQGKGSKAKTCKRRVLAVTGLTFCTPVPCFLLLPNFCLSISRTQTLTLVIVIVIEKKSIQIVKDAKDGQKTVAQK